MGRWEPNTRTRLEQAALDLYAERGFDETTVAEIARRAGLTERTFFRHFADKREVLFAGSPAMQDLLGQALAQTDDGVPPADAVADALAAVAAALGRRRDYARRRQGVIDQNPVLQERELVKLASWGRLLAAGLRERGVPAPTASLLAETGIAVFRVAFERWIAGSGDDLVEVLRGSFAELWSVAGPR